MGLREYLDVSGGTFRETFQGVSRGFTGQRASENLRVLKEVKEGFRRFYEYFS